VVQVLKTGRVQPGQEVRVGKVSAADATATAAASIFSIGFVSQFEG
jgi:hypothetical protein